MTDPASTDDQATTFFEPSPAPDEQPDEDTDAIQEPEAARVDVLPQARHGRKVGEGDAERFWPARTSEEAKASLAEIGKFCTDCLYRDECWEEECAVYRAEETALTKLRTDAAQVEVIAGIPQRRSV